MSRPLSPSTGRAYGLAHVARTWKVPRATVYRHRGDAPAPQRPDPLGPCPDTDPVEHIRSYPAFMARATVRSERGCALPASAPRRAGCGG